MNTCWECAAELDADDKFCDSCGANQAQAPAKQPHDDALDETVASASAAPAEATREPLPAPPAPAVEEVETAPATTVAVLAPREPPPVEPSSELLVDPVEPISAPLRGSVHHAVTARQLLWTEIDTAQALLATIEASAKSAAGTAAGSVETHVRLTTGRDLLAELRSIESEVRTEIEAVGARDAKITADEAEIARLNRNRMIMIASIVAGVVLLLIIIASTI